MKILNCIFLWCVGITLTPLPTPRPSFNSLKVTWMLCTKPAEVFRKNILRKIFSAKILCTPKNCIWKFKIWYKIVVGRFAKFRFSVRFGLWISVSVRFGFQTEISVGFRLVYFGFRVPEISFKNRQKSSFFMFETFINERIFTENPKNGVLQVRMKSYHIFAVSL